MTTLKHVKWSDRLQRYVARVSVKAGDAIERCIYSYYRKEEKAQEWAKAMQEALKSNPQAPVVFL